MSAIAVQLRQANVQHDGVDFVPRGNLQAYHSTSCGDRREVMLIEPLAQQLEHSRFVFDSEYSNTPYTFQRSCEP